MSLTSYRAAPPRGYGRGLFGMGWRTWRRPTLPRLGPQYHGRWGFSRPSSGWDRVFTPRHGHQVFQPIPVMYVRGGRGLVFARASGLAGSGCFVRGSRGRSSRFWCCSGDDFCAWSIRAGLPPGMYGYRADRAIRTGQLRALPRFHIQPIDVMVYHGPRGDLV